MLNLLEKNGFWLAPVTICVGIVVFVSIEMAGLFSVVMLFFWAFGSLVGLTQKLPDLFFSRQAGRLPHERREKIKQALGLTAFVCGSVLLVEFMKYLAQMEFIPLRASEDSSVSLSQVFWALGISAGAWVWAVKSKISNCAAVSDESEQ